MKAARDSGEEFYDPERQENISNKGTGGMECSVVLFKPRIHLFACTLPSVSISCDCMPCVCTSISL